MAGGKAAKKRSDSLFLAFRRRLMKAMGLRLSPRDILRLARACTRSVNSCKTTECKSNIAYGKVRRQHTPCLAHKTPLVPSSHRGFIHGRVYSKGMIVLKGSRGPPTFRGHVKVFRNWRECMFRRGRRHYAHHIMGHMCFHQVFLSWMAFFFSQG